jgi:hypothetical protein
MSINLSVARLNAATNGAPPTPSSTIQEAMIQIIRWRNRSINVLEGFRKWPSIIITETALPFLITAAAIECLASELLTVLSTPLLCCWRKPFSSCFARMMGAGSAVIMGLKALVITNLFCKRIDAVSFAGWKNKGLWFQDPHDPHTLIFEISPFADFSLIDSPTV